MFSRTTKIALGVGAAAAGALYISHLRNPAPAMTKGATTLRPDDSLIARASNIGTVAKEHAAAAVDDSKKMANEISAVVGAHKAAASSDVSRASDEFAAASKGDLREIAVADVHPTVKTDASHDMRTVAAPGSFTSPKATNNRGYSYDSGAPLLERETPTPSAMPSGYKPSTWAESDREHRTTFRSSPKSFDSSSSSSFSQAKRDERADIVSDHKEAAKADISNAKQEVSAIGGTHKELAKRDLKQAGAEVKQALKGDSLPGKATVRETPDLREVKPADKAKAETTSSSFDAAKRHNPSIGDRLREAGEVVSAHGRAAARDVAQWNDEVRGVVSNHMHVASRDMDRAKSDLDDGEYRAAPLQTPPQTTTKAAPIS